MQKKIIALAIASAFAAPAAMAEVTMYGTMDGGVRHQTNDAASAGTTDTMQMGQYNTARFGFKGVDDLGDGMKVNMVLETSLAPTGVGSNTNTNSGANTSAQATLSTSSNPFGLLFDRQATIGLSGGWGSFDMGWNYTTSFSVIKTYDPFDYKFLGVAGAKTSDMKRMDPSGSSKNQDRAGNMIYKNSFGDVTVQLEYDVNNGNKAAQPDAGPARAIGITYASGPINAGVAYTKVESDKGAVDDATHVTAGAGYNYGAGKVSVGYAKNEINGNTVSNETETNMWLGASFKASDKIEATAAYYSNVKNAFGSTLDNTTKTAIIGVTYALSKKTVIYLETDRKVTNSGASGAADATTLGTAAGLSTIF